MKLNENTIPPMAVFPTSFSSPESGWRLPAFLALAAACLGVVAPELRAGAEPPPAVLERTDNAMAPPEQMRAYLLGEVGAARSRWLAGFEERTDADASNARGRELRARFIDAIGGLPARTPLRPRVTGTLVRDGFRVEKVIFESQPRFYVTGALFLPDAKAFAPPYPGVLVPCGHFQPSKAHDEYQAMGALLAGNGMAALVFDPIDQGERLQLLDASGRARFWGTSAHTLDDIQAIPLGQSIARYFVWDSMRALDYLQSRPEVDPARLGCTGNSGGATQTCQLFALDERVKVAAPSCYVHHFLAQIRDSMGDGEQNVFGELAFGFDHPDFVLLRAPAPVKLLAATHDFFDINATWETFRILKRAYTRLGFSERIDILENDAGHNYNRTQREAAARWLARWLRGRDEVIVEPERDRFTEEELRCTPEGQVMLLPGARSIRDLLRESAAMAAKERRQRWSGMPADERRAAVRAIAHFRGLAELPGSMWTQVWERERPGFRLEGWRFRSADGALDLPAVSLEPGQPGHAPPCVFLADDGWRDELGPGGRLEDLVRSGRRVLAIDVRGTGETRQTNEPGMTAAVGRDYWDIYTAYLLGRSYVGMQAEDILAAIREAQRRWGNQPVDLIAIGGVGVPALHAAFVEPARFHHVTIEQAITSWDEVVRADRTYGQLMNVVHGALRTYDLPDLAAILGDKLTIRHPVSALGLEPKSAEAPGAADLAPARENLVGLYFGSPGFTNPQTVEELPGPVVEWNTLRDRRGQDWSAHWSGFLVPSVSGQLEFALEASEEAAVVVAGRTIAQTRETSRRATGAIHATAGEPLPCEIRFEQARRADRPEDYTSFLRLSWRSAAGEWAPVPASWLRHSREQQRTAERALR